MKQMPLDLRCVPDRIELFLKGQLNGTESAQLEEHLSHCAACAGEIQRAAERGVSWERARSLLALDQYDHPDAQDDCADVGQHPDEHRLPKHQTADLLSREIRGWLDATDDPQSMGRFAGYEIVGVIGHGGMGIVLKGFERSLNRYVAIKILAPRLATSGSARRRFSREAQAAAAVRHENVIAIHRVDEWHGLPFLVMPYAGGVSLQKRLDAEGPFSLEQILRVGMQIATGLAAAHAQGLIHRDIKPANILLEQGVERVTITDFGLARAADDASITRSGVIAGTPQYMSPEQAEARPLDARSDLFSLGSVLYAMAAGRPPFSGASDLEVLKHIVNDPARPMSETLATVPEWFQRIVDRLQAKNPDSRYSTAAEVAELLAKCLAHVHQPSMIPLPESLVQPTSRQSRDRRRPFFLWLASGAAALAMFWTGVLIVLELNKGTLTIECEADNVPIRILQGDREVERLTVTAAGKSIRVAAGTYTIEVSGASDNLIVHGGIVVLRRGESEVVRISHSVAPAETSAVSAAGSVERIPDLPSDTEVHVVGCYLGHNNQPVSVRVLPTGKPMVIVLSAYSATSWNLETEAGADVRGVILSGYYDQRFSHLAPNDLPIRVLTFFPLWNGISEDEKQQRHRQCFYVWSPLLDDFSKMQAVIHDLTGRTVSTFQGIYSAKDFEIDGKQGLKESEVAERWKNLAQRSDKSSLLYRQTFSQLTALASDDQRGLSAGKIRQLHKRMDEYEGTLSIDNPNVQGRRAAPADSSATESGLRKRESGSANADPNLQNVSKYAWQNTESYIAPNFMSYFPDSQEGALTLDALWTAVDKDERADVEILKTVREGFRNTRQHRMPILRWIGNKYIWGQSPQNPEAIELMYHAADFSGESADPSGARHAAVYFGLSVTRPKTPAILQTLAELSMRVDDPNDLDRIAWGCSDQKAELLQYLTPFLSSQDAMVRTKADVCQRIFSGELQAFAWAAIQARQRAAAMYTSQLPQFRETLLSGTSEQRLQLLQRILSDRIALIMDDSFVAAFARCAEDKDPRVRRQVAIVAGTRWVWEAEDQHSEAIELMLRLSGDEDRDVRYNAVYYGLSTVRRKSDPVIRRLLEMAMEDREWNLLQRIQWGLQTDPDRVKTLLNEYMNADNSAHAEAAREIFDQFTRQ